MSLVYRIFSVARKLYWVFLQRIADILSDELFGSVLARITPLEVHKNTKSADFCLCIRAAMNKKDLVELVKIKSLNFIIIDQEYLSLALLKYFKKNKIFLNHFYGAQEFDSPEIRKQVNQISLCYQAWFRSLKRRKMNITKIFLPSFDQGGIKSLKAYADNHGIQAYCFYYEHYTIPLVKDQNAQNYKHYKCKSSGGKLCVWHEYTMNIMGGKAFAPRNDFVVTGAPRYHRYTNQFPAVSPQKKVTLFSFPGAEYFAPFAFTDIVLSLIKLSTENRDYEFVIKCKDTHHINQIHDISSDLGNIRLTTTDDNVELVKSSHVLIGFNSLSILEGLLGDAHLISPDWGDAHIADYMLQISPQDSLARKCFNFPESKLAFIDLMKKLLTQEERVNNLADRIKLFNNYIRFDPDNSPLNKFEEVLNG